MRRITGILVLVTALAACGGESAGDNAVTSPTEATSPSVTQQTEAEPTEAVESTETGSTEATDDPAAAAASLAEAIPEIGEIIEITEDNDTNNLIGRPGQYDAATFMEDERLGCTAADNFKELATDCGAKIERWASEADAQARADDIQAKLKSFGLGAEYDYVRDRLLLRVAGDLKPSQAKAYEEAFLG